MTNRKEMSSTLTPSKRPFESNPSASSGRGKGRNTAPNSQQAPLNGTMGVVIFRILCRASKLGRLIGKGGSIVTKIRQETGAKVKIEEALPGCEEAVVVITGSDTVDEPRNEHIKKGNEDTVGINDAVGDKGSNKKNEPNSEGKANEEDKVKVEEKDNEEESNKEVEEKGKEVQEKDNEVQEKDGTSKLEIPESEKLTSSAQKALVLAFERIVSEDSGSSDQNDVGNKESAITVRLLIFSSQVGRLLGKGGSKIKKMSSDTGAEIRLLPKENVPLCASPHDDVVQITGRIDVVKKALISVSQNLIRNPPPSLSLAANTPGGSSHQFSLTPLEKVQPANTVSFQRIPYSNRSYGGSGIPAPLANFYDSDAPDHNAGPAEKLIFRLLCPKDRVGSVIGKGGSTVKIIENETGSEIKVLEISRESDNRIIVISGPAFPGERISSAQDALLRVQHRIVLAVPDEKEGTICCRLVVSADQIGALVGKGGAALAELGRLSGADIHILSNGPMLQIMPEHDEVVEITGVLPIVQDALVHVTDRLKNHLFDSLPGMSYSGHPALLDRMPPFDTYMGRREPSPTRLFHNFPPFQREFGDHIHDERSVFGYMHHGLGVPHGVERLPVPWAAKATREGASSVTIPEYPGGVPQRRIGFPGGNHPAVITNTTVEVVVPRSAIPAIYGRDGYCLMRIREISEAKIMISESKPEATETVIIISGTPEQTHAAQSLLQAFVLSEAGSG